VCGLLVVGALLVTRAPLHRVTHALPVSNDDAIPLLIARHILHGEPSTILWNQPYNGTLDAYLLAPLVRVLGAHAAFRFYEAACGLLLIVTVGGLAALVAGEAAGWAGALLAAAGTPYMALMAATGPTPNFLVPLLAGLVAAAGYRRLDGRWASPAVPWAAATTVVLIPARAIDSSLIGIATSGKWSPRFMSPASPPAGAAFGATGVAAEGADGATPGSRPRVRKYMVAAPIDSSAIARATATAGRMRTTLS